MSLSFKNRVPRWAQPRSPLVAIALRSAGLWDYRISQYTTQVLRLLANSWVIVVLFLPVFLIILLADSQFTSVIGLGVLLLLTPLIVLSTELLYGRLWLATPTRTSEMIAGEIQRQTWDIFRSTPFPRYQLVLGRLAALWWMAEATMLYILAWRGVFILGLLITRHLGNTLETGLDSPGHILGWLSYCLFLIFLPFSEIFAVSALGLYISSHQTNVRQANLMSLLAQISYRLLSVSLIIGILGSIRVQWLWLGVLFPQWVFVPVWGGFTYTPRLVLALCLGGLILPALIGSISLYLTIRQVKAE
jgi:hypothetical protein